MGTMHPSIRDAFSNDLFTAQEAVRTGVVDKRSKSSSAQWKSWLEFCQELSVDPWFSDDQDPIPYIQVFAARYRDGRLSASGKPVRSSTVEDAIRSIGQAYKAVGAATSDTTPTAI